MLMILDAMVTLEEAAIRFRLTTQFFLVSGYPADDDLLWYGDGNAQWDMICNENERCARGLFCNYDGGASGRCEYCVSDQSCDNLGLPAEGAANCKSSCESPPACKACPAGKYKVKPLSLMPMVRETFSCTNDDLMIMSSFQDRVVSATEKLRKLDTPGLSCRLIVTWNKSLMSSMIFC